MNKDVDAMISRETRECQGTTLLLRHCLAVGTAAHRVPARVRLEQALGPELARRLTTSLLAHSRR